MTRSLIAGLLFACFSALAPAAYRSAEAATLGGVTMPDTYTVNGQKLVLNGIGLRTLTIFSVKVYVAALYLPQPSHDPQQIMSSPGTKVIVLQFLHSGSKADIEKEYRAGEQNNCADGSCSKADEPEFERLVAAAPAVKVGDVSTYIYTPTSVRVLANQKLVAEINNANLSRLLLAGFIGAHPPSEDLRRSLLGLPPA